jgi:hypothetical protein
MAVFQKRVKLFPLLPLISIVNSNHCSKNISTCPQRIRNSVVGIGKGYIEAVRLLSSAQRPYRL